jgi:hypothetical protein
VFTRHEAVGRLRAAPDDRTDAAAEQWFVHPFADGADDPGELHARDVHGPSLGRGVVAVTLHEVGGVDAGTTDRDDDVVRTGIGGLTLLDFEFPIVDDDAAHPCSLRRSVIEVSR